MSQDLVSFVLRFVRETGEDQEARWRGIITHVQSQSERSFTLFSEALAFMQDQVNEVAESGFQQAEQIGPDMGTANPFAETTRMWGEFMPRYSQMMVDSMNEAMETAKSASSGNAYTQQMEQTMTDAFALWGIPLKGEDKMSSQDNPFQKNMELWQQFSDSYTKNMFAMFERNLAHSKAFQEQVQSAVSESVDKQFELILSNLKVMEEQITELSESVNEMASEKATEE